MKIEPQNPVMSALSHLFLDPWLAMLCIGGLGHQLAIPFLLTIGYWNVFLVVLAVDCIAPAYSQFKRIKLG